MIERVARDATIICVVMIALAAFWRRDLSTPLGVAGGGLLIALAFWAIQGIVDALIRSRSGGETPRKKARFQLVKFFTRHAILALAAYVMMVRLRVDPVAMLMGVSSLGAAVAVEALRGLRWRRFP
ncbi:MAG: ATP synthase subunit I [Acidobacteriota bacterium]|nr:ATP synthase subunit I [Acidobacteriota bacterium]